MALSKEHIFTLTCLKEVGIKGIGPKKIFSIANTVEDKGFGLSSLKDLADIMSCMPEKAINKVTLSELNMANDFAKRIIDGSNNLGIDYIGYYDSDFPQLLRKAINEDGNADPPLVLWYRGDINNAHLPGIAVIGTREATPEGMAGGEFLSSQFATRGFNIVSGLAVGCDTTGHLGALKVGGKTTAILANSLDHNSIYPPENQDLAEEIVNKGGLLLSEYHFKTPVNKYYLVARDRLQSGLSLATLVVQTGINGGTMHAANTTLKANKPLFVMRFKDDYTNKHEKCLGNEYLVKKGAKYISGLDNIDAISQTIMNLKPIKTNLFD